MFHQTSAREQRDKLLQKLKNQIELTEILCDFWPLPNMSYRLERLLQHYKTVQSMPL